MSGACSRGEGKDDFLAPVTSTSKAQPLFLHSWITIIEFCSHQSRSWVMWCIMKCTRVLWRCGVVNTAMTEGLVVGRSPRQTTHVCRSETWDYSPSSTSPALPLKKITRWIQHRATQSVWTEMVDLIRSWVCDIDFVKLFELNMKTLPSQSPRTPKANNSVSE